MSPAQRAALDAAHEALLAAEEEADRRRVTAGARRKLEEARAAERSLLDQHGFDSYLDVVLSGGRSAAADPRRAEIERELMEAKKAMEVFQGTPESSADLAHLESERTRLLALVTELLGVDPGDRVLPLLEAHRPMSPVFRTDLVAALERVNHRPVGVSLEAAAVEFLEANPLPDEDAEEPAIDEVVDDAGAEREIEALNQRAEQLTREVEEARTEGARTAEALQMAERSVGTFEGELSLRAGEDASRLKRFAAAEELRAQVEAVASTLQKAEDDARRRIDAADEVIDAAEKQFDDASAGVSALARQARELAAKLPNGQRPEGDVLESLPRLAERLDEQAMQLQGATDSAETATAKAQEHMDAARAAVVRAGAGDDAPVVDDLLDGLRALLANSDEPVLVLDEPFVGVEAQTRVDLLDIVLEDSASTQLVLLTEDPEVLGWAIELPPESATAVPADSLLARLEEDLSNGAGSPSASVDITTKALRPDSANAPTARRWAGQR